MRTHLGRLVCGLAVVAGCSLWAVPAARGCGWFKPCTGACGARTAAYYAPTAAYYAPVRALYAPQITAYAPATAYYAPTTAYYAPPPPVAPTPIVSYLPETHYRAGVMNVPVTLYRPVAAVDPYTGVGVSVLRPTVSYRPVAAAVPYTTYRIVQSPVVAAAAYAPVTSYYAPAPASPCATASCYASAANYSAPTASCAAPACATTATCPSGVCPSSSAYSTSVPYDSAPSATYGSPSASDSEVPALRSYGESATYEGSTYSGSTYAAPGATADSSYAAPQTYARPLDSVQDSRIIPNQTEGASSRQPTPAVEGDNNESLESRPLKPVPQDKTPYVPGTGADETPAKESSGPSLGDPSDKTTSMPWDRRLFSRAVLRNQKLDGEVPVESYDPPGGFRPAEPRSDSTRRYDGAAARHDSSAVRSEYRQSAQDGSAGGWRASGR